MKKKIASFIFLIFIISLSIFFLIKYNSFKSFKSTHKDFKEETLNDLLLYYYNNNWDYPIDIESLLSIAGEFKNSYTLEKSDRKAINWLNNNSEKLKIHIDKANKYLYLYLNKELSSDSFVIQNSNLYKDVNFGDFFLGLKTGIIFSKVSFEDIHICKFPRRDYLAYKNGKKLYDKDVEDLIIHSLYNSIIRKVVKEVQLKHKSTDLMFKAWFDNTKNHWQLELLCNYDTIELCVIKEIEKIFKEELNNNNAEMYVDSLIIPLLIRK